MNKLPPFLRNTDRSLCSMCLILEGYEEWYYFERLKKLNVFSSKYSLKLINAKSASRVPAKYQEAFNSNSYEIVLIVCDRDRIPTKKAAREDVFALTGVENYDAHNEQLDEICNKIYKRTWLEMIQRLNQISDNSIEIPSSNIKTLFCHLVNDDKSWITEINNIILSEIETP